MGLFHFQDHTKNSHSDKPFVSAVIVAAGTSSRMGSRESKQMLPIHGMPVIARTLASFEDCNAIDEIALVTREEDMLNISDIVKYFEITKVSQIIRGGQSRQQSVAKGIAVCSPNAAYFAIHDGARPLILSETISRAVDMAIAHGAAAVGAPVKDTIKIVSSEGLIEQTPPRHTLWAVQTPQVFERDMYIKALALARSRGAEYTDDCQLVEALGIPVYMCEGSYSNIKITTAEDIYVAESLMMSSEGDETE